MMDPAERFFAAAQELLDEDLHQPLLPPPEPIPPGGLELHCGGCQRRHVITPAEVNMAGSMRCACGHNLLWQLPGRAPPPNAADYQPGRMDSLAMYLLESVIEHARLQAVATPGVPPIIHGREVAHAAIKLAAMVAYPSAALGDADTLASEAQAMGDLWRTAVLACREEDPTGAALMSLFTPAGHAGTVTTDEAKEAGE